jgi:hypothetical protein
MAARFVKRILLNSERGPRKRRWNAQVFQRRT